MNSSERFQSCDAFEAGLSEALASETPAPVSTRAALRRHAESCPVCVASESLIVLAGLAAEARDPVPLPDDDRWSSVRAGIREECSRGGTRPSTWRRWAAAASIAAAGWLGWTIWERTGNGFPSPERVERAESADMLEGAAPIWAAEDWNEEVWAGASPIPDVESLDSDEREALWQWLEEEGAFDDVEGGGDA